jgi:hypothetical protein
VVFAGGVLATLSRHALQVALAGAALRLATFTLAALVPHSASFAAARTS